MDLYSGQVKAKDIGNISSGQKSDSRPYALIGCALRGWDLYGLCLDAFRGEVRSAYPVGAELGVKVYRCPEKVS
ncbi:18047_t:CDS:2, partial [Dentiscutata erythropus]